MPRSPFESWNASIKDEEFIRENYGKWTKAMMIRKFGIKLTQFEDFCRRKGIAASFEQKHIKRDFSKYKRVAVPDRLNCPTYILVKPGKCVEKAKEKYLEKIGL